MSETEKNKLSEETTPETVVPATPESTEPEKEKGTEVSVTKKDSAGDRLRKVGKNMPVGPGNFWNNMLSTVLLLVFITAAFSYLTDTTVKPEELTISDVVGQVKNNEVKEIIVRGAMLEVAYRDETRNKGEAKRETDASVSDSLTNLGVSAEQLATIKIDVQRETGFGYWLGQFAPFLFPLLFLGIIIWFLTRSVKGAGMQALSFGSSKARMIDPNDTSKKVTFKDVAGEHYGGQLDMITMVM